MLGLSYLSLLIRYLFHIFDESLSTVAILDTLRMDGYLDGIPIILYPFGKQPLLVTSFALFTKGGEIKSKSETVFFLSNQHFENFTYLCRLVTFQSAVLSKL